MRPDGRIIKVLIRRLVALQDHRLAVVAQVDPAYVTYRVTEVITQKYGHQI